MTDLVIRGGTVVTATGSRRADVAVTGGRIEAIEEDLSGPAATAEVVDATGMLLLPGVVDVHTHTRVATDAEPDRFFQDSVAAAFGGTTSFLSFNNPGTGSSPAAERSLRTGLAEWKAATAGDSAIDYGLSLAVSGHAEDPLAELPATIDGGVATSKAFMVFDFRLGDRALFDAIQVMGRHGGMLQVHCEDPVLLDHGVAAALQRGETLPRFHATSRPPYVEAVATARALAFARATDSPIHVVHLSSAAALDEVRRAKAAGVRVTAETCPHYLTLTDACYDEPDPTRCACFVISPPLRSAADRDALWAGLADGTLDLIATDHVPDRMGIEKAEAGTGVSFDRISNGAPGIETLLTLAYSEGVATGRLTVERMVDLLATTPARRFGLTDKGAIDVGKDADLVLFGPLARRTLRAADLHHTSDYTPYEGLAVLGAVQSVFVRGRPVITNGTFVGRRGFGAFVERGPISG
ncbi:MAG TPA: dihydropyrimidinase [Candidatus Saccharimonadales bacterium]|nr:dihydropyrimidinase [Candidatus Saccharimonadales bacterium]